MGKKTLFVLAFILVAAILAYYFYIYNLLSELYVHVLSVKLQNIWFEKGEISLSVGIRIYNPTDLDIEIDKIYYKICIGDVCKSSTVNQMVIVPANDYTSVTIPIKFGAGEVLELVKMYFEGKPLHVRVYLALFVPIKMFSFTITHVKVGFKEHMGIQREESANKPAMPLAVEKVEWISDGVTVDSVSPGDTVYARVVLRALDDVQGTVEVVVKEDRRFMPDRVVLVARAKIDLRKGETEVIVTPTFTVNKSTLLSRGYFVKVYLNGNLIYEMPNEYPPRLKIT